MSGNRMQGSGGCMAAAIAVALLVSVLFVSGVPALGQSSDDQGYLVYIKPEAAGLALVTSTWDGSDRNELPLPPKTHIADLRGAVSPDGLALALHTVAAGDMNFYPSQPQGIQLHLMHLGTGETVLITDVLPVGVVDTLGSEETYANLLSGIDAVAWSPDGHYLAFAALHGRSTDLHVLDIDRVGTGRQSFVARERRAGQHPLDRLVARWEDHPLRCQRSWR